MKNFQRLIFRGVVFIKILNKYHVQLLKYIDNLFIGTYICKIILKYIDFFFTCLHLVVLVFRVIYRKKYLKILNITISPYSFLQILGRIAQTGAQGYLSAPSPLQVINIHIPLTPFQTCRPNSNQSPELIIHFIDVWFNNHSTDLT